MFNGKTHYKWPCSIAMLNYQRVSPVNVPLERIQRMMVKYTWNKHGLVARRIPAMEEASWQRSRRAGGCSSPPSYDIGKLTLSDKFSEDIPLGYPNECYWLYMANWWFQHSSTHLNNVRQSYASLGIIIPFTPIFYDWKWTAQPPTKWLNITNYNFWHLITSYNHISSGYLK